MSIHARMDLKTVGVSLVLVSVGTLAACVPSPTATPPRQTPFPTLPLVAETGTPENPTTPVPGPLTPETTVSPDLTARPTLAPSTLAPAGAALTADTFPPVVELIVQDPGAPVSQGKAVALNVLAADNNLLARLELYDNDGLVAQATASPPARVYSNQFLWNAATPGRHVLRAVAYDAAGNASAPSQMELNVIPNNRAPAVQITEPAGSINAELGAPIRIQGVATDDVAVTRMDLIVDNQLVTFVLAPQPNGVTPFAVSLPWTPTTTGTHNVVLRAYDNQGQSDDSLRYTVRVFDNQPPVVRAAAEHVTISTADALVVNALALAKNGISRLELYVDEQLADAASSATPAQQTALDTALTAGNLAAGAHTFYVRAFDLNGQTTDTPRVPFTVTDGSAVVYRDTPVPAVTPPPLLPTPTATPARVVPEPPSVELQLLGKSPDVTLPNPASIQIRARGSAELATIELWLRYPGEPGAQLLLEENSKGATEKTLTFDWTAPRAGVVEMFARVTDNVGQTQDSTLLRFDVQPPLAPTPAPSAPNFAQTWVAESPAARYEVTFAPLARALRGVFVERRADGVVLQGRVVSGAGNDKNASFAIDFSGDASAPQHTLQFDCAVAARPPQLTCNFSNEKGERGSAIFAPLAPP